MGIIQLVYVGIRLFGIWFGWLAVQLGILTSIIHHKLDKTTVISYVMAVVYLLCSIAIWLLAKRIAHFIVGENSNGELDQANLFSERNGIIVVTVFVGLLIIGVSGLSSFCEYITSVIMIINSGQKELLFDVSSNVSGLVSLFKISIGLFMVMKSSWIADKISRKVSLCD